MNVAFIPVRGGSKSIPLKNIKLLCGKPLVYWTAKTACDCARIDKVYISTDSEQIRKVVQSFGLKKLIVIDRSAETASDTASTESAMLEFAGKYDFDNIVLIQATSPMLTVDNLNDGFDLFERSDCDSVFSAVRRYQFLWTTTQDGMAHPYNYDIYHRPRRQEYDGYLIENGAFYITSRERLLSTRNDISLYEIDEPSDWFLIEDIMKSINRLTDKDNT